MNFTMECIHIHCHSPIFPSMSQHLKHKRSKTTDQLLWLSNSQPHTTELLRIQNIPSSSLRTTTTQALSTSSSLLLGLTSPPPAETGDYSIILIISALLLPLYWVTNFVVPDMLFKYLQTKEDTNEEQVSNEEDDDEDEDEATSKQRGFGQQEKL